MKRQVAFKLNGKAVRLETEPSRSLLWVLRTDLGLTGTKHGCGVGQCGSCTVVIAGKAVRSCQTPVGSVAGKKITTIEGIAETHPVVKAWIKEQVPQCGYCQSGQIMQAAALLAEDPNPTDDRIVRAMDGNLCRCGTYPRIKLAIRSAAKEGKRP